MDAAVKIDPLQILKNVGAMLRMHPFAVPFSLFFLVIGTKIGYAWITTSVPYSNELQVWVPKDATQVPALSFTPGYPVAEVTYADF